MPVARALAPEAAPALALAAALELECPPHACPSEGECVGVYEGVDEDVGVPGSACGGSGCGCY